MALVSISGPVPGIDADPFALVDSPSPPSSHPSHETVAASCNNDRGSEDVFEQYSVVIKVMFMIVG